ncbi:glycosyltransferase family 2 protein [Lacticaseibacillus paracasei subsp. paracasei]|nr:glycosyltransferase family 2 protein [Lacticaseibacillus paracasei]MDH7443009.1 glycosyltransferase family 2 protein [Lacticaseibacillus paracasei subsp. paracasei]
MATYNGAQFINDQIKSILMQIDFSDELIIVDDCSTDETVKKIKAFKDPRIRLFVNTLNQGPIRSFASALSQTRGEFLFLADQDDVWLKDKVSKVMAAFLDQDAVLVVHDGIVTDINLIPIDSSWNHYNHSKPTHSLLQTLIKNSYTGAMMAMKRDLLRLILPFPEEISMHDWWIALVALKHHLEIVVLPDKLVDYRRHVGTVTGTRKPLRRMFLDRVKMLRLVSKA